MAKRKTRSRTLLFMFVPLIAVVVLVELALRIAYFQSRSENTFALESAYAKVRDAVLAHRARGIVADHAGLSAKMEKLYAPEGSQLFTEFKRRYEDAFRQFVDETRTLRTRLLIVYIPIDDYNRSPGHAPSRAFFKDLAERRNVDFLDMTPVFREHPQDQITLWPENGHLSRFGNQLVARAVADRIQTFGGSFAPTHRFETRPALLGDLRPSDHGVSYVMDTIPFRPMTNSQGLRSSKEAQFPKERQRILAIGDSVTYGVYLPIFHSYPELLGRLLPESDVFNAGVAGYTITDELAEFRDRSKYLEPDITVLAVVDNDLTGFFSFVQNSFSRDRARHAPTAAEEAFLKY